MIFHSNRNVIGNAGFNQEAGPIDSLFGGCIVFYEDNFQNALVGFGGCRVVPNELRND
jgi:hypothetical protein